MATRTAKEKEAEDKLVTENIDADVHHMIRRIGAAANQDGTITADMADAHVRTWLQAGYSLFSTHVLGMEPNGVNILYIFVKNA